LGAVVLEALLMRAKERAELGAYGNRIANLGTPGLYRRFRFAETAPGRPGMVKTLEQVR